MASAPRQTIADDPPIVQRFLAREDPPLADYRANRRLEARNRRFKAAGWLEVETELSAGGGFEFRILAEGGSTLIRNRVLRSVLENEARLHRTGEPRRSGLTTDNYEFLEAQPTDDGLVALRVQPRRKDPLLVKGRVFVIAGDADLVRVEGELARSPSFWTKRVHVVREYARIEGVRVPVWTSSRAEVRVFGPSEFTMVYRYETVNGRAVRGLSTGSTDHTAPPASPRLGPR